LFFVNTGPAGLQLYSRYYFSAQEVSCAVQRCSKNWRNTLDAGDADAVISCEISEAVGDQTIFLAFHAAHDMWAVANYQVGTRVDHSASKPDDVTTGFVVIL